MPELRSGTPGNAHPRRTRVVRSVLPRWIATGRASPWLMIATGFAASEPNFSRSRGAPLRARRGEDLLRLGGASHGLSFCVQRSSNSIFCDAGSVAEVNARKPETMSLALLRRLAEGISTPEGMPNRTTAAAAVCRF